jgi:aminopeptidase N
MKTYTANFVLFSSFFIIFIGSLSSAQRFKRNFEIDFSQRHSYDVIEYKLFMDWYGILAGSSDLYTGIMQIEFCPDLESSLSVLDVDNDSTYLHVDSAFADGKMLKLGWAGGKLNITLDKQYSTGDTGLVSLYYHVVIEPTDSQKGFYYFREGEEPISGYRVPHTIAYTMSEPSDAHYWMPCYDKPSDKATCEISVRVPNGFVVTSNGTLVDMSDNHDSSTTYVWKENYPIATYLMSATAGKFSVVQAHYVKADGDTIPVQYFVYPEDSSSAESNSECNVDTVVSMIKFYESLFGIFPFDKYGMTCIEPFFEEGVQHRIGGMEHQTITTLRRSYEFRRDVVAHELAHQWWGDMVTLGTWNDIWLNEGFATYAEAMQLQHLSPLDFKNEMESYKAQFFQEDSIMRYPIYAPPSNYIFGLAEYYKGAWVLHMLRNIVGDSIFVSILRAYGASFQYGNAVTTDFEDVVNRLTHSDMSWFFSEWIFQPGYPVYSYAWKNSGNSLVFYLKQEQRVDAPVFKMPVKFSVYYQGKVTGWTFFDSLAVQTFTVPSLTRPDSIVFDPDNVILKQVVPWGDSALPFSRLSVSNFPNPFNSNTQIVYTIPVGTRVRLEIYDVLGREIRSFEEGYQEANTYIVNFNAWDLASGLYFCRVKTDVGERVVKMLLEK